ncbi:hypothetical protein BKA62DRAFT_620247, partial [Auriculariales sp. MPI-PUGE-AT-0066]
DYYALLGVGRDASVTEVKAGYHRTLLTQHPDKNRAGSIDVSALKRAYATLSSVERRAEYDAAQRHLARQEGRGQRAAQEVSLDEFVEGPEGVWRFECRCGGRYTVTVDELERDVHFVACEGCSEMVFVGYEAVD